MNLLRPMEIDWPTLQEHFRQQCLKFGNTREQYFHIWRSFHYEENTDTIDSYVSKIKQVTALFVIPVIIDIYGHRFEVFTLVSEIHDNVDLVLGMKNVFELEGVVDTGDSSFKFLNRSLPFYSKDQVVVKPKERKFIKIETPFVDEISGLAIVKILDSKEQCTVVLKLKFVRNCASLDVTNNTQETVIFETKQMLGNLRSKVFRFL